MDKKSTHNGTIVRTFWTNFERSDPTELKVYDAPVAGWWSFETNVELDDMVLFWSKNQLRRFLYSMWDIYRYRKVQANG